MSHIGTGTIIFYKTIVAVLLILAVVAYSDTTFVCGNISGVWDAGGSPYCVVCDVHVPSGDTLIIMPDVKVVFMANFGFYVDSRAVLKAMGTISRPIIFTTADTSIFHKAINFNNSAPGCTLQYCRIDRGKKEGYKADGGGIYCYNSSPVISNNTISGNLVAWEDYGGRGGGIYCYAASPTIINNTITGNSATYDGSGGGIYCYGGNPTIYGNTISGNTAYDGGGIHCDGGNPTIINNTIFDNPANIGGGIYCYNNTPTIADNTIYENSAGNGGGIYCDYCNPTISDNIIYENWAGYYGGGIYCGDGGSIISNNSIYGNTGSSGAGIYCGEGSPTISGNTIFDNSAGGSGGGGIFCLGGYPKMIGNSIFRNTTSGSGGGIYCRYYCCSEIINNTILKNSAGSFGGGINYDKSNATLICNTISANSADSRGGAICCEDSTNIVLFNTIIWNNTAPIGTELSINYSLGSPCTAVIAYSDIELSKCFIQNNSKIVWVNSNVNSNPFFADTLYHLSDSSNCIDAGAESVFIAVRDSFIFAPDSDFEDDPRPRGLAKTAEAATKTRNNAK